MTETNPSDNATIHWGGGYWRIVSPDTIEPVKKTIAGYKNPDEFIEWRTEWIQNEQSSNAARLRRKGVTAGALILKQGIQTSIRGDETAQLAAELAGRYEELLTYVDQLDAAAGGNSPVEIE
jgi:hypothetical protein